MRPNISLLRDHGVYRGKYSRFKLKHKLKLLEPYIVKFTKDDININYIATNHTIDKKSKTFKLIKKLINNKIDLVIIEGLPFKYGINPQDINYGPSEIQHALSLSLKHKVNFSGVEPTDNQIYKNLLKLKFSKNDIILWECLRMYKIYYRDGFSKEDFYNECNVLIPFVSKNIKNIKKIKNEQFNFDNYYEKTFNIKFNYGKTDLEISSPNIKGNITNKISHHNSLFRDAEIMQNTYKLINRGYKNIVIIYGQNHLYAQFDVFSNDFDFKFC